MPTLKEKLALDALKELENANRCYVDYDFVRVFVLGFNKAKGMASDAIYDSSVDPTGFISNIIRDLGEDKPKD